MTGQRQPPVELADKAVEEIGLPGRDPAGVVEAGVDALQGGMDPLEPGERGIGCISIKRFHLSLASLGCNHCNR